jgi:hypothetical protein
MSYKIKVAFTQETEPDLVSKGIMYALGRPYSHVLIMFEDTDRNTKIFHCIGKGTCIDNSLEYLKTHKIVKAYDIPMKCTREEFAMWVRGRCGREYSDSQYANILLNMIGIKWVPFKNDNAKAICSEEVAAAAHLSQLDIPENIELDLITPKDVEAFLDSQPKAIKVIG